MPKLLDAFAADHPDDLALSDEYGETTWSQFHERTRRLINALRDAGLGPGDTVAMLMGNRRECFELFQACAHTGITYVPVNWHWVADEVAYVLRNSNASAVLRSMVRGPDSPPSTDSVEASVSIVKTRFSLATTTVFPLETRLRTPQPVTS